jgi:hypothetical protein
VKAQRLFITITIMITLIVIVPSISKAADIVNPKQTYTYEMMVQDIKALHEKYPNLIDYKIIGSSEYKRPIYAVSLGNGTANLFINGSHHAREWITTNLNMYMIEQYAKMYENEQVFGNYNVEDVLDKTKIWFVPMVNPDGVTLQQFGLNKFPVTDHSSLIKMNEGSRNFAKWKANAKGVDLNRQYNAGWATIKSNSPAPRWSHHKGYYPEQASEVKTLVKFTAEIKPEMAVSYHSSGEILYWNYLQSGQRYTRDQTFAKRIGQYTGYRLIYPGYNPSGGGYTDWFISKYKRPAFTPELGRYAGETHVPLSEFDRIWAQNKFIGLYTASESYKLYLARGGTPKPKEVNVNIDGNLIKFDQPALLLGGSTVVPVRGVFEKLGASVEWNQATQTITAKKDSTLILLKIGSKTMTINNEPKALDVAPQTINNRTMIPLRAVSEALGAKVSWDKKANTAYILSPTVDEEEPSIPPDSEEEEVVVPPAQPVADPVTDVSRVITGSSDLDTVVIVKKDEEILGQAKTDKEGRFEVPIPVQKSDTVLTIVSNDKYGNTSEELQITVTYTNTFTDTVNHWSKDDIGYLKDNNVTKGLPDGSFGVDSYISRAESAVLLVRALKLEDIGENIQSIPDVPVSHGYYKEISKIYQHQIMKGNDDGLFNPNGTLTRAEMAVIIVNAFKLSANGTSMFPDVATNHWAYESIKILANHDLAGGYPDGTFRASAPIKRSEFATLLAKALKKFHAELENQTNEPEETIPEETQTSPEENQESQTPAAE